MLPSLAYRLRRRRDGTSIRRFDLGGQLMVLSLGPIQIDQVGKHFSEDSFQG